MSIQTVFQTASAYTTFNPEKLTQSLDAVREQLTALAREQGLTTPFTDGGAVITDFAETDPGRAYTRLLRQSELLRRVKAELPHLARTGVTVLAMSGVIILASEAHKRGLPQQVAYKTMALALKLKASLPRFTRPPVCPTVAFVRDLAAINQHVTLNPLKPDGHPYKTDRHLWEGPLHRDGDGFMVNAATQTICFPASGIDSVILTVNAAGPAGAVITISQFTVNNEQ